MHESKLVGTPLGIIQSSLLPKLLILRKMKNISYSNGIRSIIYRMMCRKLDEAHTVCMVSRFIMNLGHAH